MANILYAIFTHLICVCLGVGTCFRGGVIPCLYGLAYFVVLLRPKSLTFQRVKPLAIIALLLLVLLSIASLILSITTNSSDSTYEDYAKIFGFVKFDGIWSYFQNVFPEALIITVGIITLPILFFYKGPQKTDTDDNEANQEPPSRITGRSVQIFMLILSLTSIFSFFPRVLTIPFAVSLGVIIILYAFTSLSLITLFRWSSLITFPYAIAFYIFTMLYQIEPFRDKFSSFPAWLGVGFFSEYFTYEQWNYFPTMIALLIFLYFSASLPGQLARQDEDNEKDKNRRTFSNVLNYFHPKGWDIIVVGFLCLCLGVRGVVPFILLLSSLVSTSLSTKIASKFAYHTFVLEFAYVVIQFIINIPEVLTDNFADWENFGFFVYHSHYEGLYFTSQTFLLLTLAFFLRNDLGHAKKYVHEKLDDEDEEEKKDVGEGSEVSGTSANTSLAKFNETLTHIKEGILIFFGLLLSFIVEYSYIIALILVYFCSLAKASVFNFVFLLFFLVFFISPRIANRFWSILVAYSQVALLLLYSWQTTWSSSLLKDDSMTAEILGFKHYDNNYLDLGYHALIFVFVLIQWRICDTSNVYMDTKGRFGVYYLISEKEPPQFVITFKKYFPLIWKWIAVGLFVVAGTCIALLPSITIISLFYILVICCLTIFPVIPVLSITSLVSPLIITYRYIFQIAPFSDWFKGIYSDSIAKYFPLYDLGLTFWEKNLASKLFPDVAFMVISVLLLASLVDKKAKMKGAKSSEDEEGIKMKDRKKKGKEGEGEEDENKEKKDDDELTFPYHLRVFIHFILKVLYIFTPLVILISASFTAVGGDWDVMCFVLLLVIVLSLPASKGNTAPGKALLVLCEIYILAIYAGNLTWLDVAAERYDKGIQWVGIVRIEREGAYPKDGFKLSDNVSSYVLVVLFTVLKYYLTSYMEKNYAKMENESIARKRLRREEKRKVRQERRLKLKEKEKEKRRKILKASRDESKEKKDGNAEDELYNSEDEKEDSNDSKFFSDDDNDLDDRVIDEKSLDLRKIDLFSTPKNFNPLTYTEPTIYYVKWYCSNILSVFRYPICLICCCIALCCRSYDFLGYAYLLVLFVAVEKMSKRGSHLKNISIWIGYLILACMILFQYIVHVGLPPPLEPENPDDTINYTGEWPWNGWFDGIKQLMLLARPKYQRILLADLAVLLTMSRLTIKSVGFFEFLESLASETFPNKPRTKGDSALAILINASPAIVLLLLFIAGTARMDGMSLVYVFLCMFILVRGSLLKNGKSKIWTAARFINSFMVLVQLFFYTAVTIVSNFEEIPSGVLNVCSFIGFSRNSVSSTIAYNVFTMALCAYHLSMYSYLSDFCQKLVIYDDETNKMKFENAAKELKDEAVKTSLLWEQTLADQEKRNIRVKKLKERRLEMMRDSGAMTEEEKYNKEHGIEYAFRRSITYAWWFKEDFKFPPSVMNDILWHFDQFIGLFCSERVCKILDLKEKEEYDLAQIDMAKERDALLEEEEALRKQRENDRYKTAEELAHDELIRKKQAEIRKKEKDEHKKQKAAYKKERKAYKKDVKMAIEKKAKRGDKEAIKELERRKEEKEKKKALRLPTRFELITEMIIKGFSKSTKGLCIIAMVINNAVYGSIFSFFYILIGFGFILLSKNPKPSKHLWSFISFYSIVIAVLKFFFSMPGWCLTRDLLEGYDTFKFDLNESCPPLPSILDDEKALYHSSWVYVFAVQPRYSWFVLTAFWDVLLIVLVFVHRSVMLVNGYWREEMGPVRSNTRLRVAEFKSFLSVRNRLLQEQVTNQNQADTDFDDLIEELPDEEKKGDEEDKESEEGEDGEDGKERKEKEKPPRTVMTRSNSPGKAQRNVSFYDYVETSSSESESDYEDNKEDDDDDDDDDDGAELKPKRDRNKIKKTKSKMEVDVRMLCDSHVDDCFVPAKTMIRITERDPDPSKPWKGTVIETEEEVLVNPCFAYVIKSDKKKKRHKRVAPEEYPLCSRERDNANLNRFILFRKFKPLRNIFRPIYHYLNVLAYDPLKGGADLYTPLFAVDLIVMIVIFLFPGDFVNTQEDVQNIVTSSTIPLKLVLLLMVQFFVIVIDRIIYVSKALTAKIILQYLTLIVYLILLIWVFPKGSNTTFTSSFALIAVFLLKCIYWFVSAHQIREGYPKIIIKRFCMNGYFEVHSTMFAVYRAIPFLFELRTILDWALADTALSIFNFFKFEAIYTRLYNNKCVITKFRARNRRIGGPRLITEKLSFGVLLFAALCLVLWIPMLLLSSGGFTTTQTPITEVKFTINYEGYLSLYEQTTHAIREGTDSQFSELRKLYPGIVKKDDEGKIDIIVINSYSEKNWDISKPALEDLLTIMDASDESYLTVSFQFTRKSSSNNILNIDFEIPLDKADLVTLEKIISEADGSTSLEIEEAMPRFVRLPGVTGEVTFLGGKESLFLSYVNELDLATGTYSKYWIAKDKDETLHSMVIIGTAMPISLTSSFASVGLIGLYSTYILMVFNIVRDFLGGSATDIPYQNMTDVDDLLSMVEDLLQARQIKDLVLEESIFCELVEIFRSPERILKMTKEKLLKRVDKNAHEEDAKKTN